MHPLDPFLLAGFEKDRFYWYQAWYVQPAVPVVHILPHWNWNAGDKYPIWVFSNADEIELFVNGVSQGRQVMPMYSHVEWDGVPFVAGSLHAVAYVNGTASPVADQWVNTTGPSSSLRVYIKDNLWDGELVAGCADATSVAVDVIDAAGNVNPLADDVVTFTITGDAQLAGTSNGDPACLVNNKATTRPAFHGRVLAVVLGGTTVSDVVVTASAPGLGSKSITIPQIAQPEGWSAKWCHTTALAAPLPATAAVGSAPCDLFAADNVPCVAAHSVVRALFSSYAGALYQVRRLSDNTTLDIEVLSAGGFANAASQDAFCAGTDCVIQRIYDQSPFNNDLNTAPAGGHVHTPDRPVNASRAPFSLGPNNVYAAYFEGGMGYRIDGSNGTATGNDPQTIYMVTSGKHINPGCCFDYGLAESTNNDNGPGTVRPSSRFRVAHSLFRSSSPFNLSNPLLPPSSLFIRWRPSTLEQCVDTVLSPRRPSPSPLTLSYPFSPVFRSVLGMGSWRRVWAVGYGRYGGRPVGW